MAGTSHAQSKPIAVIKKELEASENPPLYVKQVLKKNFVLDTIGVMRTTGFSGIADSLAYHGKVGKVYGPYQNGKVLVQLLARIPNTFNRISQIFIDTTVFTRRMADSLSNDILARIRTGSSFEDMARTWSMGGEGVTGGDLGWVAEGSMIEVIEKEIRKHKTGELFKVWSRQGVHILKKSADPKQDKGFALMMRIFL